MILSPPELAVAGTLGGVLITAIASVVTTFINKRSEERKHLATLTTNAAIEHWNRLHEGRKGEDILPLDIYLVHMAKLAQEVLNGEISKENIAVKLRDIDEIVTEMQKYAESVTSKKTKGGHDAQK